MENIYISNYENLRKIASPTANSFAQIKSFTCQECTGLTSIPADLFDNCPNVTRFNCTFAGCTNITNIPPALFANCSNATVFWETFMHCQGLTSIPQGLLDNCTNVTCFGSTFEGCTSLTGNAPELWKRVPNGETNEYVGTPDGESCFYDCSNLTNYGKIPGYWKTAPKPE